MTATTHHTTPIDGIDHGRGFLALALGSVGVVYGDIGTSPLYALREALAHTAADGLTEAEVVGVVSLLLWSLTLIVTIKYVLLILRADNNGEGGTLSLLALAQRAIGRRTTLLFALGVLGAALFYGDAMITPAISVLSAVEGLELVTPGLDSAVIPLTVVILVVLFAVQAWGTATVSAWFGPVTLVWFAAMALLGVVNIAARPGILLAVSPLAAAGFLAEHGILSLAVIGSVFLAVTGAEALYADMGHFGRRPIQAAWMVVVFPSLALNYLGQGSLVLVRPEALENPFFLMAPEWALLPLVGLATAATVIASQAVISGAYSLTQQAIQLGLLPRLEIRHTSAAQVGQVYMPRVNWTLLAGVLALVFAFRNSGALANAYGIAVTGTMVITTVLAAIVARRAWGWSAVLVGGVFTPLMVVEVVFLGANVAKVMDGGYAPLAIASVVSLLMWTWVRGTDVAGAKARAESVATDAATRMMQSSRVPRVPGTAVFLTSDPDVAPAALLHNLKHNKVLHEQNILVTVRTATTPRVPDDSRLSVETLDQNFTRIVATFGYMEEPNVPRALALARKVGVRFDIMSTSFFLNRRSFRPSATSGMPLWQDRLYIAMTKSASDATGFYRLPSNRVVELGQQFLV